MLMAYEEATSCLAQLIQNRIRFEYVGKENPPPLALGALISGENGIPMKVKLL